MFMSFSKTESASLPLSGRKKKNPSNTKMSLYWPYFKINEHIT